MNTDDKRAIAECLAGRPAAYSELVRRYQDRLYNAVFRVTNNADDALDVVQDAFINAYQSLKTFKGDSEFFTWLYRIAFNAAISVKRKKRAVVSLDWTAHDDKNPEPIDESDGHDPGTLLERSENEMALQNALQKLSPEHRVVLVLKEIEGQKYEDIAAVLDVPIGTVRSRLHRARLELRAILDHLEE